MLTKKQPSFAPMKSPKASTVPSIQVLPLIQPTSPGPVACHTLAELIHALGPRTEVAQELGVVYRTLTLRMQKPETATLDELQRLAVLAKLDLEQVFQLAVYQMQNPSEIPASQPGRPSRQH